MPDRRRLPLPAAHRGVYRAEVEDGTLRALHPFGEDAGPSLIGQGYVGVLDDALRIKAPMVRELQRNNWHDQAFLERYTTGFATFADYLSGAADGIEKTPEWASEISRVPAPVIAGLARRMAPSRGSAICC